MSFIVGVIILMLGLQLERRKVARPSLICDGIASAMVFLGAVMLLASGILFVIDDLEAFK